jgi:Protein of unknown function (DUF2806)
MNNAAQDEEEQEAARNVSIPLKINVTDLLGLGKAAKSPAGEQVARAFRNLLAVLTEPSRTLLVGLAETKVETHRITATASAKAEALEIEVDAFERMKQRVVATELRRQDNIETITAEAIEHLNQHHANDESRPIDDDWMASWLEGAKEASASEVRSMWARLLEAQALSARNTLSGPSLALLRNLDGNLARAFSDFICYLYAYGCYPLHEAMPKPIAPKDLAILKEVGFVEIDTLPTELDFRDFKLRGRSGTVGFRFTHARLTHRAYELAAVIYPDDAVFRDRLPDATTKTSALISYLEGTKAESPFFLLVFRRKDGEGGEVAVRAIWSGSTPSSPESFSATVRELNASAQVSQFASDVLKGLHERGMHLDFVKSP